MAKPESNTFFKAYTSVNRVSKIFSPNGDIVDFTWNMKAIYLYILQFQGNVDSVFLSQETISQELGMDRMTVNRLLKKMELAGIYRCGRGQGKSWKGFKSNVSRVITLDELDAMSHPEVKIVTKTKLTVLPNAVPVEKEDAGSINSASGHQNNTLESTAIIRNLDLDDNGPDIQLSDSDVELTEITGREVKLTGANDDDVCLTVVESGHSTGSEINMDVGRFDGEYLQVKGQLIRTYETEPKSNEWELDPAF